jgi:hypothetical protein
MKTIKSSLVVLFVLLTAQIASAYYCPSTGRWLSRDPLGEMGFQALQVAAKTTIKPTPLAPSDRWINRDLIPKRGEKNLYGFVENKPVSFIDYLGLQCQCGVKSLKLLDRGWTTTASSFQYRFDIVIKLKTGSGYSKSCCQYLQWVQSTASLNGVPETKSAGGTPMDGKLHIDSSYYIGDNYLNQPGAHWDDETYASQDEIKTHDTPGWGGFANGDVVVFKNTFVGTVIDICNNNKVVAKQSFKMHATGTWPNLDYAP